MISAARVAVVSQYRIERIVSDHRQLVRRGSAELVASPSQMEPSHCVAPRRRLARARLRRRRVSRRKCVAPRGHRVPSPAVRGRTAEDVGGRRTDSNTHDSGALWAKWTLRRTPADPVPAGGQAVAERRAQPRRAVGACARTPRDGASSAAPTRTHALYLAGDQAGSRQLPARAQSARVSKWTMKFHASRADAFNVAAR